jgi:hypothetical protein
MDWLWTRVLCIFPMFLVTQVYQENMFLLCLLFSTAFLNFLSFGQIWFLIDNLELSLYTGVLSIFKQCIC